MVNFVIPFSVIKAVEIAADDDDEDDDRFIAAIVHTTFSRFFLQFEYSN